jgi:hypothetical protein
MPTLTNLFDTFLGLLADNPLLFIAVLILAVAIAWILSRFALRLVVSFFRLGCFLIFFMGLVVLALQLVRNKGIP